MGCSSSNKNFVVNSNIPGQDYAALTVLIELGLSMREIDIFFSVFLNMDTDNSHTVQPVEFFSYFEIEATTFGRRLFSLFNEGIGGINFLQFACLLWNILTLDESNMGCLAFMLADPTATRMLSYTDIKDMFECIHKKKMERDPALRGMLIQLKRDLDSAVKVKEFTEWTNQNSSILTPIRILQTHLRLKIVGTNFWVKKMEERRLHSDSGNYDFIPQLRNRVITETKIFYNKRETENQDKMRISRNNNKRNTINTTTNNNNTGNNPRKKSILVDYFNLKLPTAYDNKIVPVDDPLTQQNSSDISPKYRQRSQTTRNISTSYDNIGGGNSSKNNSSKSPVRRRDGTIASFSSIHSNTGISTSTTGQSGKAAGNRSGKSNKYQDAVVIASSAVYSDKRQ